MKKFVFIFVMLSAVFTGCARQETTWQEAYDNGQDYMIAKEYRKAEKSFERAVEFDEEKIEAYSGLYHAYMALNKTEDASRLKNELLQKYDEFDVNICLSRHETIFETGLKVVEIESNEYVFRYHFFNEDSEKIRTNYYAKSKDGNLRDYDIYSYFTENGLSAVETTRFTADNIPADLNTVYYNENNKAVKYTRFHSGIKGDIPDETHIYRYDRNGETSEYERYQNGELLSKYYYSLTSDSGKTVKNPLNYGESTYTFKAGTVISKQEVYFDSRMKYYSLYYPTLYTDSDGWSVEYYESYTPDGVLKEYGFELYKEQVGRWLCEVYDPQGNFIYRNVS